MIPPEFSRPVQIDTLGPAPRDLSVEANEDERASIARRFGLQAVARLSADAALTRSGDTVRAKGKLAAAVTQSCVVTGAPVEAEVAETFHIEFRPQPEIGGSEEEIELSENELDVVFYGSGAVDLGEAVAESLSLALDPYPRCPDADATLAQVGVHKEGEEPRTGPLAGLKDLLDRNLPRNGEGDRDA
ncbi:MAG TPA: DUF177 domain-containing protein [Allosphingosinicella sp.]|jgi:uncharacterized metal-binding protein YceD (DUF177 family)